MKKLITALVLALLAMTLISVNALGASGVFGNNASSAVYKSPTASYVYWTKDANSPAFDGKADNMKVWGYVATGSTPLMAALYTLSGTTYTKVAETETITCNSAVPQWWTLNFTARPNIYHATAYYMMINKGVGNSMAVGYTASGSFIKRYSSATMPNTIAEPANFDTGYLCVYTTYTYYTSVPTGVTSFTGERQSNNTTIKLNWTRSATAEGVRLIRGYNGFPANVGSPYVVYEGAALIVNDNGLNPFLPSYYVIYEYNYIGWSNNYGQLMIGGMPMSITLPNEYLVLAFACFCLFLGIFIKKMFWWIILIPLWYGVIYTSSSEVIQGAAGLVMIFCIIMMFQARKKGVV